MEPKNNDIEKILPDLNSLTQLTRITRTEGEFGREVIKEIFNKSKIALQFQNLKDSNTLVIPMLFTVRKVSNGKGYNLGQFPGPNDVNVCWEISSSLADYINCSTQGLVPGLSASDSARIDHLIMCENLQKEYDSAKDQLSKLAIMHEMILKGCSVNAKIIEVLPATLVSTIPPSIQKKNS